MREPPSRSNIDVTQLVTSAPGSNIIAACIPSAGVLAIDQVPSFKQSLCACAIPPNRHSILYQVANVRRDPMLGTKTTRYSLNLRLNPNSASNFIHFLKVNV